MSNSKNRNQEVLDKRLFDLIANYNPVENEKITSEIKSLILKGADTDQLVQGKTLLEIAEKQDTNFGNELLTIIAQIEAQRVKDLESKIENFNEFFPDEPANTKEQLEAEAIKIEQKLQGTFYEEQHEKRKGFKKDSSQQDDLAKAVDKIFKEADQPAKSKPKITKPSLTGTFKPMTTQHMMQFNQTIKPLLHQFISSMAENKNLDKSALNQFSRISRTLDQIKPPNIREKFEKFYPILTKQFNEAANELKDKNEIKIMAEFRNTISRIAENKNISQSLSTLKSDMQQFRPQTKLKT